MKDNEYLLKIENIKSGGIYLPEDYFYIEEIPATFFEICIRFYKEKIDLNKGRFIILDKNERDFIRTFYSHQADYKIKDGIINLYNSSKYAKLYEFKRKLLMVKNNSFFDIVEINNIANYLDKMGMDIVSEDEIEKNDEIILKRNVNYKLKYWFK